MTVHLRIHTEKNGMIPHTYPEPFQYPGGEWDLRHVPEIPADQGKVTLIADVRGADPNDLIKAALWGDVADRGNLMPPRVDPDFVIMLPYMPAARADRGIPLGVTVYARLIRGMTPTRTIIMDPHSRQAELSLTATNLRVADHLPLLKQALETSRLKYDGIIIPDKGAGDRAAQASGLYGWSTYQAGKVRDFETGKLSGFRMVDEPPATGNLLIVDDICDGGGTFKGLATHLQKEYGVGRERLGLWVTHGVFSGDADGLRSYFTDIMTTDSHPGALRPGVATTIVPCFPALLEAMKRK